VSKDKPTSFVSGDASGSTFINCYTNADQFFGGAHEGAVVEYWIGPDDSLQAAVDSAPPGAVIYVHRANRGGAVVGPDGVHLRFLDPDDFDARTPPELDAEDPPASPSVLPATTPSPATAVGPPADGDMLFFTDGNRAWSRPYPDGEWTELKA
jgi:hypothetical protein